MFLAALKRRASLRWFLARRYSASGQKDEAAGQLLLAVSLDRDPEFAVKKLLECDPDVKRVSAACDFLVERNLPNEVIFRSLHRLHYGVPESAPNLMERIALAALQFVPDEPVELWIKQKPIDLEQGNQALADLCEVLAPLKPFLISGTLLGVMREGRLLGHDKDIDIGIFGDLDRAGELLKHSGMFKVRDPDSGVLKAVHRTGTAIDVFLHHVEGETVWHGSAIRRWANSRWWADEESRFSSVDYGGRRYLIPADWRLYLADNYGDWETPMPGFDACIEAPNLSPNSPFKMRKHLQRRVLQSLAAGQPIGKLLGHYIRLSGADRFTEALQGRIFFR